MPHRKKKLEMRKQLAYKLITYYGLLLLLLFTIGLNIQKFDARQYSPISLKEQLFFKNESLQTEQNLDLDEIFERNLSVETENGYDVILEDLESSVLSGINQSNIKALQSFIFQSRDMDEPLQRRFETLEVYGPFLVKSKTKSYNQYFIQAVDSQDAWFNTILDSSFLMIVLLMIIGAPFLLWLSFKITKPIRELARAANTIAEGHLVVNPALENEGFGEIREVGKSFNHMVKSLQDLTRHQQQLISNISHELKTPLARMQLATALLRRKMGESPDITRIEGQLHKLDKMVQDLLTISRQQLSYQINQSVFAIEDIWSHILDDARFEFSQNHLYLTIRQKINHPEDHYINGNLDILASSLENLIRNGQKYAKRVVCVSMDIKNDHLILTVEDDGPGVSEQEYENILKPFYRIGEDRDRKTGGTGLGLAIVHNAVIQHKGKINITKSGLGGLRVELGIPLWTQQII